LQTAFEREIVKINEKSKTFG